MDLQSLISIINSYLPEPHASLANGILFGKALKRSTSFYTQLKQTGLLHIVVLSGTNITILAAILGSLLSFLPKKLALIVTICLIALFISFIGPQAPAIRAGVMGILALMAVIFNRKALALYSLLLASLFTAIFFPKLFMNISFQLSFGATLGIILFGNAKPSAHELIKELRTSLAAQVFVTPLILIYFREMSIIAPISTLMVSFVIAPLMIMGFLTILLGKISWYLGVVPAAGLYFFCWYIVEIVKLLSQLPLIFVKF